jgi:hypothetical protein
MSTVIIPKNQGTKLYKRIKKIQIYETINKLTKNEMKTREFKSTATKIPRTERHTPSQIPFRFTTSVIQNGIYGPDVVHLNNYQSCGDIYNR